MRRRYVVICVFFGAFALLSVLCYGSYRYGIKQRQKENFPMESEMTNGGKQKVVTSNTKLIVEKYDRESEELIKEERRMPAEYIGLTRQELQNKLVEELATISKQEEKKGLVSISLESFSKEKVVVRNIYEEIRPKGFVLRFLNNEIAIYSGDGNELYEMTGIMKESLSEEDCNRIQKGYKIQNEKELYSILENFSS